MRFSLFHIWAAVALLSLSPVSWALDPNLPPGGNFDLSHWKLQLPTSNGIPTAASGTTDSASAAQLEAGFTNAYFYTGGDGALVFWATNNGARTGGSTHPRSELREQLIPGNDDTNWNVYGTHILTATCVVSNVPSDRGKVCIGQMHQPGTKLDGSPSANTEHLIMFDLNNLKIYANINPDGNNGNSSSVNFLTGSNSVQLGKPITYTMSIVDGLLKIIINNVTNSWGLLSGTNFGGDTFQNWDRASGNTLYFKAGSYNQVTNYVLAGGARVAFTSLTRYHAATITNQPASFVSGTGSNVAFTVAAVGNATNLAYQWLLNTTTVLAGATNSTLNLTNITFANAGNYTVVVIDPTPGFNAITSSVATLSGNFLPVITSQPASQTVSPGSNATFAVTATGAQSYRWCFNNTNNLPGATNASLTISNAQIADAGNYTIVVSNTYGVVTSAVATLTLGDVITSTNILLDDRWADGTRNNTALPTDAAWFANIGASLVEAPNALIGVPDTGSGATLNWWTYFTTNPASPVQLGVTDTLRVTLAFTPYGVNSSNNSRGLRLGLFNASGGSRTVVDGANPNGTNHTGYMLESNLGQTFGGITMKFQVRTNLSSNTLINTTTNTYAELSSGGPAAGSVGFSNGVSYVLQLLVKRNASSADLTAAFSTTYGGWSSLLFTGTDPANSSYAFDTYVFRVATNGLTATNFTFTQFKVELIATNNHPPVPGFYQTVVDRNQTTALPVASLLAGASDVDGEVLAINAVSSLSTNLGTVVLARGTINYTPPAGYVGADRFSYTLTDARGAATTGDVFLTVAPPLAVNSLTLSNQSLLVDYIGTPGSNYVLQTKAGLNDLIWLNQATNTTDSGGLGSFVSPNVTNNIMKLFRISVP